MLTQREITSIKNLLAAGQSALSISQKFGRSMNTIYKYGSLKEFSNHTMSQERIPRKIFPFQSFVEQQIKSGITNKTKLYSELIKQGYVGSYSLLSSYLKYKASNQPPHKRSQHVATAPGEQAQVDWGYVGKITIEGKVYKLYVFVYVLSYSRALYIQFVVRQNEQTFQECHINAFKILGIPKTILYDNIKTVVLKRERLADGSRIPHFNPAFIDFSTFYNFTPVLCPPYWPRSKGKVEAGVKYVKNNFMQGVVYGKNFKNLEEINNLAKDWLKKTAQERIHKATHEKPQDLWRKEKKFLHFPNKKSPYIPSLFSIRYSNQDGLVFYKYNFYSVPMKFARRKLYIRESSENGMSFIEIFDNDVPLVKHKVSNSRGEWIIQDHESDFEKEKDKKQNHKNILDIDVQVRPIDFYDKFLDPAYVQKES